MFQHENIIAKLAAATNPLRGWKTFYGFIKDLPEDLKNLALQQGKLTTDDLNYPNMEVKIICRTGT